MIAVLASDTGGPFDGVLDYSAALGWPLFVRRDRRWFRDGAAVPSRGRWPAGVHAAEVVLVQYSPANWDPAVTGFGLPLALRALGRSTRVVLVVHELDNLPSSARGRVRQAQLRLRFAACRLPAYAVVATTGVRTRQLGRWLPRRPAYFVPVGANVPDGRAGAAAVRDRLGGGVVVATLTAPYRAHPALVPALAAAARGRDLVVLNLGAESAPLDVPSARVIVPGPLPAADLAAHIAAADVFVAAYPDGASGRRGSLVAALRQGVPVVANLGPATDPFLAAGLTLGPTGKLPDALVALLDDPDRAARGRAARALYEERFTWDAVRAGLLRAGAPPGSRVPT